MEWILGNGRGDFASGSASGARPRTTHALLAVAGPGGCPLPLLLRLDARVIVEGRTFELAPHVPGHPADEMPGAALEEFRADPWPRWRQRAGNAVLEHELFLVHGHPAVIVSFRHLEGPAVTLALAPVLHASAGAGAPEVRTAPGRVTVLAAPGRSLTLWHAGAFVPAGTTPEAATADAPAATADEERDFVPGAIEAALAPGEALHLIASAEELLLRVLAQEDRLGSPPPRTLAACVAVIERGERARREAADQAALERAEDTIRQARTARHPGVKAPPAGGLLAAGDRWTPPLARALGMGWIEREGRASLVRSLPGCEEHGAAALRAVRGLITLRDYERARDVLCAWGQLVREGLAPSSLDPAGGHPRYDESEASLWLVIVTELYARRAGDHEFVRRALYPALEQVIERFRAGTRLGVRVDGDSLLVCGEGERAAKRADLNALWCHAQAAMGQLARALGRGDDGAYYLARASEHQARFNEAMWDEESGCLYQALTAAGPVRGLEPGQLLAVSLPPPLLPPGRALRLVQTIERELFTPLGLRESPGAARVTPEWLGPFLAAHLRVHGRSDEAQARAREWLDTLDAHLEQHTAGHLPAAFEVADEAPLSDATIPEDADAVSVVASAELLRTWVEEFDHGPTQTTA